jgi:hypothetical protein
MADMPTPTTPAATPAQPNLGYGKPTEATIDQVNIWMRSQPWYQNLLKSWGQDPNNVHLSDSQKQQIIQQAQANGVVVDQGNMEVDPSGNFNPKGHKLRNTLIVAGLAAATIATMGAAGAFSGAAAGAMGAGEAAGAGAGAAGAAGTAGAAGGLLASTATVPLATGTIAGSVASGAVPAALAAGGTTAATGGTLASMASRFATNGGLADVAGAVGRADTAAGNNRLNQQQLSMQANRDNILGNNSYEKALQDRAAQEAALRKQALKDVTLANDVRNPHISQFNTQGARPNTPEYMSAMSELEKRGLSRLQQQDAYTTDKLPALQPYQPLPTDANGLQDRTGTKKSILESVGDYASPVMSIASHYWGS